MEEPSNIDRILNILQKYELNPLDNLLMSAINFYLDKHLDKNILFCKNLENKMAESEFKILGASYSRHYNISSNEILEDDSLKNILSKYNIILHIKKNFDIKELNIYKKLIKYLYDFNTPHILPLIGSLKISDCKAI